jgi:CcmD family protein
MSATLLPALLAAQGAEPQQLPASYLVVLAYLLIWAVLLIYVLLLGRRQRRLDEELGELRQRLEEQAAATTPAGEESPKEMDE